MTTQSVPNETTETPLVPVDIFVSQNPNHPVTQGYFTKQASVYVFDAVKQMLGHPSSNRLAKLLGIPNPHHIYRWKSGNTRPSQLYLGRMLWLLKMKFVDGVRFENINRINWTSGEHITYENRNYKASVKPNIHNRTFDEGQSLGISHFGSEEQNFIKPNSKSPIFGESTQVFQND
jgi:hypothetical protein